MDEAATERFEAALSSRYRIEGELGEGGMATVYLAEDLKHDRRVAIKVLRPELASVIGAERFLAEIKTTANLQHPHILPLFDSGEADGRLYYVMPYVEGESLRDRLAREKQLPVDDAVRLAREVADALDYAHGQGVIHRDIKPENVLLRDDRALVADFGVALAVQHAGGTRLTETGLSLGTPRYMSPEQVSGEQNLSARSDVYALGCVLYEMLAGQPPHQGPTAQAVVASILSRAPEPVEERRKRTPRHVARAVQVALEKIPADRFGSARAFADALEGSGPSVRPGSGAPRLVGHRLTRALPWALAAGLLLALTVRPDSTAAPPVTRFTVTVPEGLDTYFWDWSVLEISPDGRTIAYVTDGRLHLRDLDAFDDRPIPGSDGAVRPFFSPDGEWVAFTDEEARFLRRVSVAEGGQVTRVADASGLAPTWGHDGWIVHGEALGHHGLWRLAVEDGRREQITTVADSALETFHTSPEVLPDGAILFTVAGPESGWRDSRIAVAEPDVQGHRTVIDQATTPLWAATGHVLFIRDGTVWAQPYDLETHTVSGSAVPVLTGLTVQVAGSRANLSLSETGTLVYAQAPRGSQNLLLWVDRAGTVLDTLGGALHGAFPRLSTGGDSVALEIREPGATDIWIVDATTGEREHFTFDAVEEETPQWSSDGKHIAYTAARTGQERRIFVVPLDRQREERELIYTSSYHAHLSDWSNDDEWLAFYVPVPGNLRDIWVVRADGSEDPRAVAATEADESDAVFSPAGDWIAYSSGLGGEAEIFVVSFPELDGLRQVSVGGGEFPRWSADGDELFYMKADTVMAVSVARSESGLVSEQPRPLFSFPNVFEYDPAPDGERFLLRVRNDDALVREIHVVLNWFEVLKEVTEGAG